jgi:hypothetical protein
VGIRKGYTCNVGGNLRLKPQPALLLRRKSLNASPQKGQARHCCQHREFNVWNANFKFGVGRTHTRRSVALEEVAMKDSSTQNSQAPRSERPRTPLPVGYRQGIITAITVVMGFSLLFVRFWDFELPGAWSVSSAMAAILMTLAIVLQLVALWRSLQVKDDDETEYRKTLRWFLLSAIVLLTGLVLSALSFAKILKF